MKVLIAPDSFKESLSAVEACESISKGILEVRPDLVVKKLPIADGGEGTVDAFISATGGKKVFVEAVDPLGRPFKAFYGVLPDKTVVIEVAAASGLHLLSKDERDPLKTSSYGTGLILGKAMKEGSRKFIIALGGSATNDGGAGIFQALGGKILTKKTVISDTSPGKLLEMDEIDPSGICPDFFDSEIIIACDVENSLLGREGATYVYGPQKGGTEQSLPLLEDYLNNWAGLLENKTEKKIKLLKGTGAAGGMALPFLAFANCSIKRGFELVKEVNHLEDEIREADLIISGEGKIDRQTLNGKTVKGILDLIIRHSKKLVLFTGKLELDLENEGYAGIKVYSITDIEPDKEKAVRNGFDLLQTLARENVRHFLK